VAAVGLGFYSAVWAMSAVVVSIFHFRDGRQTERWFYPDDAIAWNSIFGG
jgi:ketosteroid isomerase-like protein